MKMKMMKMMKMMKKGMGMRVLQKGMDKKKSVKNFCPEPTPSPVASVPTPMKMMKKKMMMTKMMKMMKGMMGRELSLFDEQS
jgi:hypothetical protein